MPADAGEITNKHDMQLPKLRPGHGKGDAGRASPSRHKACHREAAPTTWLGCICTKGHILMPAGKGYLLHGIHTYTCPIDLDFVCVHRCVGHQDLCILYPLGLPHSNLLIQDEALIQEGILNNKWPVLAHQDISSILPVTNLFFCLTALTSICPQTCQCEALSSCI